MGIGFSDNIGNALGRSFKTANNGKFNFISSDTDPTGVSGSFDHDGCNYGCISERLRKWECLYFGALITSVKNDLKSIINHVNCL